MPPVYTVSNKASPVKYHPSPMVLSRLSMMAAEIAEPRLRSKPESATREAAAVGWHSVWYAVLVTMTSPVPTAATALATKPAAGWNSFSTNHPNMTFPPAPMR